MIRPVNDQVLIKVDSAEEKSQGGLFLGVPDEPVKRNQGIVSAVGDHPVIKVEPGDKVFFEKGMGRRFNVPTPQVSGTGVKYTLNEEYVLISYYDVIAKEVV